MKSVIDWLYNDEARTTAVQHLTDNAPHSPTRRMLMVIVAWLSRRFSNLCALWRQSAWDSEQASAPTPATPATVPSVTTVAPVEADNALSRQIEAAREEARTWEVLALDLETRLNAGRKAHAAQVNELMAERDALREQLRAVQFELDLVKLTNGNGKSNGRPKLPRVVIVGGHPQRKETVDLFRHRSVN